MIGNPLTDMRLRLHGAQALRTIESYWTGLACGGHLPRRSQIDPAAIQDALEYAFLADRIGACHARLRVAGGAVAQVFGEDVAGVLLSMILTPSARSRFDAGLRDCFETGQSLEIELCASRRSITARMTLYPLCNEEARVMHLLGCLVVSGAGPEAPVRFDDVTIVARDRPKRMRCETPRPRLRLVVDNG